MSSSGVTALRQLRNIIAITDKRPMVAHVDVSPGSRSWLRLARRAKLLATLTLVWLGIEGTVGVVAGILAGSIA
jgi:hypothetical protein